jgi:hypothetical protein
MPVKRSSIRLAPPEVDQPFLNEKKSNKPRSTTKPTREEPAHAKSSPKIVRPATRAERDYRPWTDDTGSYTIVAKYVGADGQTVTLLCKKDDKEIKVPLARLSEPDREVAERLKVPPPKPGNPFD